MRRFTCWCVNRAGRERDRRCELPEQSSARHPPAENLPVHCSSLRLFGFALPIFVCLCVGTLARAVPVVFFGIDDPRGTLTNTTKVFTDFQATLGTNGTDTLEGIALGATSPSLTFGASGITATTKTGFIAPVATFAFSGTKVLVDAGPSSFGGAGVVDDAFQFNQIISAFGFFATNAGDGFANDITLRLINSKLGTNVDVLMQKMPGGASQTSATFWGVTDPTGFDSVLLVESNDFDAIVMDNFIAGFVVPEPNTLLLLVSGGAMLLWARRRRSN